MNILPSDDKRRARLICISHLLSLLPCKNLPRNEIKIPKRSNRQAYDDDAILQSRNFVLRVY